MHALAQMAVRRPVSIRFPKYQMPSANCLKQPARCKHHGRSPIQTPLRPSCRQGRIRQQEIPVPRREGNMQVMMCKMQVTSRKTPYAMYEKHD